MFCDHNDPLENGLISIKEAMNVRKRSTTTALKLLALVSVNTNFHYIPNDSARAFIRSFSASPHEHSLTHTLAHIGYSSERGRRKERAGQKGEGGSAYSKTVQPRPLLQGIPKYFENIFK